MATLIGANTLKYIMLTNAALSLAINASTAAQKFTANLNKAMSEGKDITDEQLKEAAEENDRLTNIAHGKLVGDTPQG